MLKKLDYDVDSITDENEFMNRLDTVEYTYVIYDIEPFTNMKCMIADVIRDSGAKPLAFAPKELIEENHCADALVIGIEHEALEEKLKSV